MNLALGIVYIAAGLFTTLSGFSILQPFKNHPERRENIQRYRTLYQYGGLVIIAYGLFKLFQHYALNG